MQLNSWKFPPKNFIIKVEVRLINFVDSEFLKYVFFDQFVDERITVDYFVLVFSLRFACYVF